MSALHEGGQRRDGARRRTGSAFKGREIVAQISAAAEEFMRKQQVVRGCTGWGVRGVGDSEMLRTWETSLAHATQERGLGGSAKIVWVFFPMLKLIVTETKRQ